MNFQCIWELFFLSFLSAAVAAAPLAVIYPEQRQGFNKGTKAQLRASIKALSTGFAACLGMWLSLRAPKLWPNKTQPCLCGFGQKEPGSLSATSKINQAGFNLQGDGSKGLKPAIFCLL